MATAQQQSFTNHTRWDPVFHFFAAPVALLLVVASIAREIRHPSIWRLCVVIGLIAGTVIMVRLRMYALLVQDRVIRLEERLRLISLSDEAFRSRVYELNKPQLIALRFASDGEVVGLAQRAVASNMTSKQIKEAIQVWRPDLERV